LGMVELGRSVESGEPGADAIDEAQQIGEAIVYDVANDCHVDVVVAVDENVSKSCHSFELPSQVRGNVVGFPQQVKSSR